ncbi:MAG: esterase, partial [Chloroflexi bacterium]|nr:esterase [Chloroflexota bacterium]
QFLDSAIGNYASHLTQEVVPAVDARFRTLANRDHRGVFGHSSGGYGAIVHAMMNPDVFGGVAARAPDMYWEFSALPAVAKLHGQLAKWGGFAEFIEQIPSIHPKRGDFWQAIHTVMQCMAYGPNPDSPLGFDAPIDLETGALIPEVWQRWLAWDPIHMLENTNYINALRQMRVILLEAGAYDEYQLQVGARVFSRKLQDLNIKHQYEEFPDGHGSTSYRYDVSLPILAAGLSE